MSKRRKPQSRNPAAQPGARPGGASPGRASGGAVRMGDAAASGGEAAAPVGGTTKAAAVGLWAVVGAGLVYGISQTAVKVVALFG